MKTNQDKFWNVQVEDITLFPESVTGGKYSEVYDQLTKLGENVVLSIICKTKTVADGIGTGCANFAKRHLGKRCSTRVRPLSDGSYKLYVHLLEEE